MSATAIMWSNKFNTGISYVTIEKLDYPVYFYGQIISLSDVAHVWCFERDASHFFISFTLLPFFCQYRNIAFYATFLSQHTRRYWSPLGAPGKKDTIDNPRSSVTLGTRSGTPSGVSLREEKERAVTYQELIHAEGTSERRESAGSGGPQGIAGCTRERKRDERVAEGGEGLTHRQRDGKAVVERIARGGDHWWPLMRKSYTTLRLSYQRYIARKALACAML